MAPKKQFSKEQIVDAAFDIAQKEGIREVTIRKVASMLDCSVAPVYVNFDSGDELLEEVVKKISDIANDMMMEKYTDNTFLNTGIGHLKFALKYHTFYKDLLLVSDPVIKLDFDKESIAISKMKRDNWFRDFTDDELNEALLKMRIFVYGVASMVVHNLLPEKITEDYIMRLIGDAGKDIVYSSKARKLNKRHVIK
jgi:AcrR family transcriptional regulator